MKKILFIVTLLFIAAFSLTAAHAQDEITVLFNGGKIDFDVAPVMQNDRIMVPVRAIFEKINAQVQWDEANSRVIATKNGEYCAIEIGSNILKTGICEGGAPGGKLIETASTEIDAPATIIDNRTLIPLRAVSQAMRATVDWNGDTKTCTVTTTEGQNADGWFYYASWSDTGRLYKIDSNGNHRQKLVDLDCYKIFYRDGWVYFYTWSNRERLYRVDTNGENLQQLTQERVRIIHEEDDWVYYTVVLGIDDSSMDFQHAGPLYRMHWDGSKQQLITNDVVEYSCFDGDIIYYSRAVEEKNVPYTNWNFEFYKVSVDGTNRQKVWSGGRGITLSFIRLHNGYLYYQDGHYPEMYLYRLDPKNYTIIKMSDNFISYNYYFLDDCILYIDKYNIMTIDYNGRSNRCIVKTDNSIDNVFFANNKVYYYSRMYKYTDDKSTLGSVYELWRCDFDGKNQMKILESGIRPVLSENIIFGSKSFREAADKRGDGFLYTDLEGKNITLVSDEEIDPYNIHVFSNKIYVGMSGNKLCRYNMDGSNKTQITNEETMFFTFAADGE